MTKKINILLFLGIIFFLSSFNFIFAQLNTNGKIVNKGEIIINKKTLEQTGGHIDNQNGKIFTSGPTTTFTQDTLLGYMEYNLDDNGFVQYIPQIVYDSVLFYGGRSKKEFRKYFPQPKLNLTSLSYFYSDSSVNLAYTILDTIKTLGYVSHFGYINSGQLFGRVAMVGFNPQDIDGRGIFKELELNNTQGADVINRGGFSVNIALELKKGWFRNNDTNNFAMMKDSKIIRWSGAGIDYEPIDSIISVYYKGDSSMVTGAEIPKADSVLQDLFVENDGGLYLNRDVIHHDTLYLKSFINTELDTTDTNRFVLTSTAATDPIFENANSEIIGSYRRTTLKYNAEKIYFNNKYTYVLFGHSDSTGGIAEMTFRVIPKMFPPEALAFQNTKVERDIHVSAKDSSGTEIDSAVNLNFVMGYGWRHIMAEPNRHETNNLPVPKIILQRWEDVLWRDIRTSDTAQLDADGWAFSQATDIRQIGQFAIGISDVAQLVLRARAILEGDYRYDTLASDLAKKNLIPYRPPDMYPYNLDPNRDSNFAGVINSDIVDWVLVEFYKESYDTSRVYYRCAFMRSDGMIVDIDGTSPVSIAKGGMEEGNYFIGIRHRNHLPIFSDTTVAIFPSPDKPVFDMTKPDNILGGSLAMKPVGFDWDNSILFGMVAGDVDGDGYITDKDDLYENRHDIQIWEQRDIEGYLPGNVTLSGYIHTRDLNYTWDNRGRSAITP